MSLARNIKPALVIVALLLLTRPSDGQLAKGWRILFDRGMQIEGVVQPADIFTLSTYTNANFTSIMWQGSISTTGEGRAPGYPWGRWVTDTNQMPPLSGEAPFMSQLLALQLGDEPSLNDGPTRTAEVNWFTSVRTNFPNTILFDNNYGGQVSDANIDDFVTRAQPDMLCFDQYPFQSDYSTGVPLGGPFTSWLSEMRRYRQWGINFNLPVATYMQTFHAVEDYDSKIYRNPSASELRFNASAALAFNVKFLMDFTYNAGATSLFDILPNGYSGDTYTNALYNEAVDLYRRSRNLGKSLVYLQPVYDLHNPSDVNPPPGPASAYSTFADGTVTSIMIIRGRTVAAGVTNATPLPNSFAASPASSTNAGSPTALIYTWWEFPKNDAYLSGFGVTNKAGIKNYGLPGDAIIAWFKPFDPSFEGTNYSASNEVYFLVVNGLTDTNGTAADCMQEIHLDFSVGTSGLTSVVMLDPETGLLQTNTMTLVSSKRRLTLDLNGGDAVLFKFADGAPFVGQVTPTPAQLSLKMHSAVPAITFQGAVGAHYQVQSSPSMQAISWTTLTNLLLPSSPFTYFDAPMTNSRYYRVLGLK